MTFRWPKKLTLVATGTPSDLREDGGRRSGHWISSSPIAIAGFNLGEYERQVAGTASATVEVYANRQIEDAILSRLRRALARLRSQRASADSEDCRSLRRWPAFSEGAVPPSPAAVLKQLGAQDSRFHPFFRGHQRAVSVRSSGRFSDSRKLRARLARTDLFIDAGVSATRNAGRSRIEEGRAR